MNDPSGGVPPQILRHVHLVSNHRFPAMPSPNIEMAAKYLRDASRLTREVSTMSWRAFMEPPRDGTVMLVWQAPALGNQFPSDGYIWADPERAFSQPMDGNSLEMWVQQSGFWPGVESVAMHARRRYRIVPARDATGAPTNPHSPADPCLWLVHYYLTDPTNQIPSRNINVGEMANRIISERNSLQAHGYLQLQFREFMLHDREHWPTLALPGSNSSMSMSSTYPGKGKAQAMGYPNNVMAHMNANANANRNHAHHTMSPAHIQNSAPNVPNANNSGSTLPGPGTSAAPMSISTPMPMQMPGPSPAKRPRHASNHAPGIGNGIGPVAAPGVQASPTAIPGPPTMTSQTSHHGNAGYGNEYGYGDADGDDDAPTTMDFMDAMTPQIISRTRYVTHHEWLEEVLNSPYDSSQIVPGSLGLGRKGELESLTKDFFDAPLHQQSGEVLPLPDTAIQSTTTSAKPDSSAMFHDPATSASVVERPGRMAAGKAEDFTKRAAERMAVIDAQMTDMKSRHAAQMSKIAQGRRWRDAEQELRVNAMHDFESQPPDRSHQSVGKSDGTDGLDGSDEVRKRLEIEDKTKQIVNRMQQWNGRQIRPLRDVETIQAGGLEIAETNVKDGIANVNVEIDDNINNNGNGNGNGPEIATLNHQSQDDILMHDGGPAPQSHMPSHHFPPPPNAVQMDESTSKSRNDINTNGVSSGENRENEEKNGVEEKKGDIASSLNITDSHQLTSPATHAIPASQPSDDVAPSSQMEREENRNKQMDSEAQLSDPNYDREKNPEVATMVSKETAQEPEIPQTSGPLQNANTVFQDQADTTMTEDRSHFPNTPEDNVRDAQQHVDGPTTAGITSEKSTAGQAIDNSGVQSSFDVNAPQSLSAPDEAKPASPNGA